jgi:hypothetical protein
VGELGSDQTGQERVQLFGADRSLGGDLVEAGVQAIELEVGHRLDDLVSFHHVRWILVPPRERVADAIGDRLGLELERVGRGMLGAGGG